MKETIDPSSQGCHSSRVTLIWLLVSNVVIPFRWGQLTGELGTWMETRWSSLPLLQHGTQLSGRRIYFDYEGEFRVGEAESGCRAGSFIELLKGEEGFRAPGQIFGLLIYH